MCVCVCLYLRYTQFVGFIIFILTGERAHVRTICHKVIRRTKVSRFGRRISRCDNHSYANPCSRQCRTLTVIPSCVRGRELLFLKNKKSPFFLTYIYLCMKHISLLVLSLTRVYSVEAIFVRQHTFPFVSVVSRSCPAKPLLSCARVCVHNHPGNPALLPHTKTGVVPTPYRPRSARRLVTGVRCTPCPSGRIPRSRIDESLEWYGRGIEV